MPFNPGTGVVRGGENEIQFYAKEITSLSDSVAFTSTDLIGELTDCSGMGSSRESKEMNGYHYDKVIKTTGSSTDNDVSFTENLTTAELTTINTRYTGRTLCAYGAFKGSSLLYGFAGEIVNKGMTLPNGDVCTLTYTVTGEEKTGYTIGS